MALVTLRPLLASDRDQILAWRNLPEVSAYMYRDSVISPDEHASWFEEAQTDRGRRYWIVTHEGNDVGLANLYGISKSDKRCSWAFYIGTDNLRGKGVGSAVEFLVLSQVFEEMAFNKLCCEVLLANEAVWRLHKKVGFHEEGRLQSQIQKGGSFHDVVLLALLVEQWPAARDCLTAKLGERGLEARMVS